VTHFLKYVSARLFFGTFAALFVVYRVLIWYHEGVYGSPPGSDWQLIVTTWLVVLVLGGALMSLWGRWRVAQMLDGELEKLRKEYHPKLLLRGYSRLLSYLGSCWFFNTTRDKLSRRVATRFGDILLGMRIEDQQALAIYEDVLEIDPGRERYYEFLIKAYSRRARLEEKSFNFLRRRWHEEPDDRLVGILAREYTLRRKLNFESERVLLRAITLYPRHQAKIIRFAVPRLIPLGRTDDNAAKFYLAAAAIGYDSEVAGMLRRIEADYRARNRDDALANRLFKMIEEKRIPAQSELPDKLGTRPGDWGEHEDDGSFQLEGLGGEDGDESLNRRAMIDAGRGSDLSMDSRVYGWMQRLTASGKAPAGGAMRYLRLALVFAVISAAVYFTYPLWKRFLGAFGEDRQVTEETSEMTSPGAEPVDLEGKFSIQIAALGDSARAAEMVERFIGRGLPARISATMAGGRNLYRVRLGAYDSEQAAEVDAGKLLGDGVIDEWQVVPAAR
jgi:hypothetical protein